MFLFKDWIIHLAMRSSKMSVFRFYFSKELPTTAVTMSNVSCFVAGSTRYY